MVTVEIAGRLETTPMTVQELIDALLRVEDKSRKIDLEGCDCVGGCGAIDDEGPVVLLKRATWDWGD